MGILKRLLVSKNDKELKDKNEKQIGDSSLTYGEETIEKNYKMDYSDDPSRIITENCEQILESERQMEELKVEYQAVTSYLTDIQKIDQIPAEDREQLNDAARKIITFTRERSKYQSSTVRITDYQFVNIGKYEEIIPSELAKMKEYETYQETVEKDMSYLEREKDALYNKRGDLEDKQHYLKKITTTISILVITLFIVLYLLQNAFQADMQIPFILTIVMALGCTLYVLYQSSVNKKESKRAERKLNRAIQLLNKVKIKYINNRNALDYNYQKYMVKSYEEFYYLWELYLKTKEEEKRYRQNTELLEQYNRQLTQELKSYELTDPEIWIYQAIAIIDNKEMVEVRHRLNVRRQKLRERIDYTNKTKERSIEEIQKILDKNPEQKEDIIKLLERFGINL
ncbi:hypothetical protein GCM10023142_10000 [Anaerocolumna aminovalerica]|jgi:hypothetical protein|uniref:Uncharacterized protein n=1 Tax=Anaerocolumna aminovalerica TaxID=1527 RepID=A0A1I5E1A9_9FIRM|nr:hypothetical protein [Anaerocolumna aminovalerica]MBU5331093.1 hypothetical protein [Anaerocolumna aminovalerica]SFO05258.1 hypothetical protein SAMN04489757_107123 [Anaerocolumna aminovalerica]